MQQTDCGIKSLTYLNKFATTADIAKSWFTPDYWYRNNFSLIRKFTYGYLINTLIKCAWLLTAFGTKAVEYDRLFTLKRNRNATLFQWKIHGVVFKVLDRDNEPSSFQEMLRNRTTYCLKWVLIKKKCITVRIMLVLPDVNVSHVFRFRRSKT